MSSEFSLVLSIELYASCLVPQLNFERKQVKVVISFYSLRLLFDFASIFEPHRDWVCFSPSFPVSSSWKQNSEMRIERPFVVLVGGI